ncbi:MAG: AAA family ATPase, partial [Methanoregula sp.]|nr:AAA family ATPase [Methanoregula sp.]
KVVHLTDTIRPYIIGDDEQRDAQIFDDERWAAEFVPVNGFVESHFAHLLACDRIVVLRCRPDELKQRLELRNYSAAKIQENADAEALDDCLIETVDLHDAGTIFELDTTGRDPVYCADQIEGFLAGKIPAQFGSLDWSGFLEVH